MESGNGAARIFRDPNATLQHPAFLIILNPRATMLALVKREVPLMLREFDVFPHQHLFGVAIRARHPVPPLAEMEKLNDSYISRILRLTLLAPDIVTAILDGLQPEALTLADLMGPLPMLWSEQRKQLGFESNK